MLKLHPPKSCLRFFARAAVVVVPLLAAGGCGLTCDLQGVPHDYADCESASAALSERNLTGGEKMDLEECIVESCDVATAE